MAPTNSLEKARCLVVNWAWMMVVMKANRSQKDALKADYSADRKAASWARCLAWRM